MSILSFQEVHLILANRCILDHVNWQIQPQERIALVGRNGAGKSTLLKLLQGSAVQDAGFIHRQQGLRVAGLAQDVPLDETLSVYDILVQSLGAVGQALIEYRALSKTEDWDALAACQHRLDDMHAWDVIPKVETIAMRLGVNVDAVMSRLSGGMKRRVLLAAALIVEPDLLLLDEPTNHLDVETIEWLESYLKTYPGSLVVVTHDRDFLSAVATRIVELDRGHLHSYICSYEQYLDRREAARLTEQKHHDLFDKRLAEEEVWLRTGVKARRTRNEGRVRALKAMRETFKQRRLQVGKPGALTLEVARSGNVVIEAQHINYAIQKRPLIRDFSYVLMRGEKVGIIGPNGCGKTTLVRLLLGELQPDSGTIKQGTSLSVAYFDQLRRQLNPNQTVMENVADGADHVTIGGKSKHVASYLRDFLFTPERFHQPVSSLSGGECNRLLLAKLFARPVNLLVMDEPTNDLDMETLELLESMLVDYPGTLLLISHDRAFINQVVTSILIYEEDGCFHDYVGGYDEYRHHRKQQRTQSLANTRSPQEKRASPQKLSYQEQRELAALPQQIDTLEHSISSIHQQMANPDFYQQSEDKIVEAKRMLMEYEAKLEAFMLRWELLEEKK